jgi:hypothetical protein
MAYTTSDDIIREVRGLEVSSETVVTEDDLTEWIAQTDAYIDGRLSSYYETPITAAAAKKIVKNISTYKVAHRVKLKLELNSENSDKKQDVQGNLDLQAEKMLNQLLPKMENGVLREPLLELPGATKVNRSPEGQALSSYNSSQTPTFTKGGNNW